MPNCKVNCSVFDGNDEKYCNWELASKIADALNQNVITRTNALQTFNAMQHVQNCIDGLEDKLNKVVVNWAGDPATAMEIARINRELLQLEEYLVRLYIELGNMFGINVDS